MLSLFAPGIVAQAAHELFELSGVLPAGPVSVRGVAYLDRLASRDVTAVRPRCRGATRSCAGCVAARGSHRMTAEKASWPLLAHSESVLPMKVIMRTRVISRAGRILACLRETWDEVDYANRRMIELRMAPLSLRVPPVCVKADELEAMYALPSRAPDHGCE
jgi:hypothetical protein